ncbi:amidase family protein [Bradyrhizobium japonicum]|uniref:amidase family protein n=1 Tax=Bradyrhizobium japonicum TaxID=375 RepID=UPI0005765F29|nr:amidase family protein [Bradyrhizobium japonicum]
MDVSATQADEVVLSVKEHVEAVRSGRLKASQIVSEAIRRAKESRHLNAMITIVDEVPKAVVESAASKPLAAFPIVIKDIVDVAGLPNTGGTPRLKNWVPATDAPIVSRLKEAGAIVIGKANLHELSFGITSNNAAFGPVRNPYDPTMIAGGSSGGSAAVVGARVVAASIGGDTAGSNRIPGSLCGCVGFRPTVGRYPGRGVIPLCYTRDTLGIFARSVADVTLLDPIVSETRLETRPVGLAGKRLGVPRQHFYENLDPQTAAVIEKSLAILKDAGAVLIEVDLGEAAQTATAVSVPSMLYETFRDMSVYLARHRCPIPPWEVVAEMAGKTEREMLSEEIWGNATPTADYNDIIAKSRPAVLNAYRERFRADKLDALVLPTTPLPARPVGDEETVELNGKRVSTFSAYLQNTDATAFCGMTSISVPAGLTDAGLPVGLSFDALPGGDAMLLSIAGAYEKSRPCVPAPKRANG